MNASQLISRVDKVLTQVNATNKTVYKRVFNTTGGDPVLGKGGTTTKVDTQLVPPPAVMSEDIKAALILSGSGRYLEKDEFLIVSISALSRADIQNPKLTLVFKDTDGHEEEARILHYYDDSYTGSTIIWNVVARLNKWST